MLAFLSKSFDLKICFWSIDCRTMIGWNLFEYLHEIKKLNPFWFHSNIKVLYTTFESPGPHLNDYWISMGWPLDEFWGLSEFPWSRAPTIMWRGPDCNTKLPIGLTFKKLRIDSLGLVWKIHVCQKRSQQVNTKPHVPPLNF
jgi:hypothetical protein